MNLRDAMLSDVSDVFLNLDEFGEEMTVNGVLVPALWNETLQPENHSGADSTGWGVVSQAVELFLHEGSIPQPLPREEVVVDGVSYSVIRAYPQTGILRLELERFA